MHPSFRERGLAVFVSGLSTGFSGNLDYPLPRNRAFDQISTKTLGNGDGKIEIDNNIMSGEDEGQTSVGNPSSLNKKALDKSDLWHILLGDIDHQLIDKGRIYED